MPAIKTEPGVRIKSEHEPRFDFSSIPRPPVPSAPVKQEDRKPDPSSSTYNDQSRRRRRFRHANNFMVHRLRDGETIRAQYKQSEGTVVFSLSRGAAAIIDNFPEEGRRAEEIIFQRLRRANFGIQPTEPSGFLYRKIQGSVHLFPVGAQQPVYIDVERISGHGHPHRAIVKQEQVKSESESVAARTPNFAGPGRHGDTEPPPSSTSSSGTSQPAVHVPQAPSDTPKPQKPSQGIFNMFRPKEQSNIFSHHIASGNTSSPSLGSSSAIASGHFTGSGDQSTRSSRSIFSHSFPEPKSPFPTKSALWSTNSSTAPSLFGPPAGAHPRPFAQLPPPDAPVLAAAVKPAPGVIVIDSSPESYPASSPKQHLPKQRVPGITAPSAWATAYGQSASPFSTNPLSSWAKRMEVLMGQFDDPMSERAVRSRAKDK